MTQSDALALLKEKVAEFGQAAVARELGYSPPTINQVLRDRYQGNLDNVYRKVIEVYGNQTTICPVLGEIPLAVCAEERVKGFSTSRHRLYRACKQCPQKGGK